MNRIEFRWAESKVSSEGKELQILVDGKDLIELLKTWEYGLTDDEANVGTYAGLEPRFIELDDPYYIKFQGTESDDTYYRKALLLVCGDCGNIGCWNMIARVSLQGNLVTWSEFEQPHRGPDSHEFWNYSAFGPFNFDAAQYFTALEQVRQQATEL